MPLAIAIASSTSSRRQCSSHGAGQTRPSTLGNGIVRLKIRVDSRQSASAAPVGAAPGRPGPFVVGKMWGCAKGGSGDERTTAPLLLMTTGAGVVEVTGPRGTPKLMRFGETK